MENFDTVVPSFAEFVNEKTLEKIASLEEAKTEFKDITKQELAAIYSETDLEIKKEKAILLINSLSAKKEKEKLTLAVQKATTPLAIDRIVTNIALVPFAVVK
jgi:hypothetical protein